MKMERQNIDLTIVLATLNEIGELENNGSKLQKDNNKVKKDFDEYKLRQHENVDD